MTGLLAALAILIPVGPCPSSVESSIRAVPRYAHLQGPMRCSFIGPTKDGGAGWAFKHGGRLHSYFGQAHIYRQYCGPTAVCYVARVVAFAGHLS